ncbi:hypothetical protein [Kosmotoga olearia]|uniref:Uncharacterized protein n=1 Tax=Kosmotoga olearia (strain ATCC BAA-1733 / DSM 21960 / TBF 19.5.1) TaxID=521045 RepID=C5CFL6_KOSOT|nr:hypothetical protein [Kosmotoga olearia]ACR79434.1 hypothetical protein Kole_0719 [Kosmotoga olearia TBF 19.5.1]
MLPPVPSFIGWLFWILILGLIGSAALALLRYVSSPYQQKTNLDSGLDSEKQIRELLEEIKDLKKEVKEIKEKMNME